MTSTNTKVSGVVSTGGAGVLTLYVALIQPISRVELTVIESESDEFCLILTTSPLFTVHGLAVYAHPFILYSQTVSVLVILIGVAVFIHRIVCESDVYGVLRFASSTSINEKLSGIVSGPRVAIV